MLRRVRRADKSSNFPRCSVARRNELRKAKPLLKINTTQIEVFEPKFTLLDSLKFLDVEALKRVALAEIAIGAVDGGCCLHTVYARFAREWSWEFAPEECPKEERTKLSREDAKVIADAQLQAKPIAAVRTSVRRARRARVRRTRLRSSSATRGW